MRHVHSNSKSMGNRKDKDSVYSRTATTLYPVIPSSLTPSRLILCSLPVALTFHQITNDFLGAYIRFETSGRMIHLLILIFHFLKMERKNGSLLLYLLLMRYSASIIIM